MALFLAGLFLGLAFAALGCILSLAHGIEVERKRWKVRENNEKKPPDPRLPDGVRWHS